MKKFFLTSLVLFIFLSSCIFNIGTKTSSSDSTSTTPSTPSSSSDSTLYSNFEKTYNKLYTTKSYSYSGSTEITNESGTAVTYEYMTMKVEEGISTMRIYNLKMPSIEKFVIYKDGKTTSATKGSDGNYTIDDEAFDHFENNTSYIDLNKDYLTIAKDNWEEGIVLDQNTTFYIDKDGDISDKNQAMVIVSISDTDFGSQIDIATSYSVESYIIP